MTGQGLPGPLGSALDILCCPQCPVGENGLTPIGDRTVGCVAGHRFDAARQGYLPLLGGRSRTDTGDDAAMVAAREEFLGAGHYRPIADAVAAEVAPETTVLEIGAGTGYYLAHTDPTIGIALDASRYAARRAAKAHPRVASVLADAWAPLPIRDAAIDTVLVIFAPRAPAEIARVLRPGGTVLVVTPDPEHLAEIRGPLGMLDIDPGKAQAVADSWGPAFEPVRTELVTGSMQLRHSDIRALVAMGPTARHRSPEEIAEHVARLDEPSTVTLAVSIVELCRKFGEEVCGQSPAMPTDRGR